MKKLTKKLNKNQQAFWNFIDTWSENAKWVWEGKEVRPAHYNLPHSKTIDYFNPKMSEKTVRRNLQMLVNEGYLFAIEVTGRPTIYTKVEIPVSQAVDLAFGLNKIIPPYNGLEVSLEDSKNFYNVSVQSKKPEPQTESEPYELDDETLECLEALEASWTAEKN